MTLKAFIYLVATLPALIAQAGCALFDTRPANESEITFHLEPDDVRPLSSPALTVERRWSGAEMWDLNAAPPDRPLLLHATLLSAGTNSETHVVQIERGSVAQTPIIAAGPAAPVVLTIDQPGGSFTFAAAPVDNAEMWEMDEGVCRIILAPDFVSSAQQLEARPSTLALLRLALLGADAPALRGYASLEPMPSLTEATRLFAARVDAEDVQDMRAAGYRLNTDDLIMLRQRGVSVESAVTYRQAGYELTGRDLIRLHEARISPDYAAEMSRLDIARSADELLLLDRKGITPQQVATLQQAGYDVPIETVIVLHERGVKAEDALALRETGYDLSVDDLLKLQQWDVPTDFAIALWSDGFRPLTAEQMVELRLRRITPQMVQLVRQQRSVSHEALATPTPAGTDPEPTRRLSDADLKALQNALEP